MTTTDAQAAPAGSPTATVQALYAAFGAGDLDAMLALVDPDVDWSVQIDAPGAERVPMFRNGRGHDAVRHYFSGVAELEFHRFEPRLIVEQGDTVLVDLAIDVAHRGTGKSTAYEEIHRFRVGADGRICAYRPFLETTKRRAVLRAEVAAGRLDREAVSAVLDAAEDGAAAPGGGAVGCRSRAGATLFALDHGLLGPPRMAEKSKTARAERP